MLGCCGGMYVSNVKHDESAKLWVTVWDYNMLGSGEFLVHHAVLFIIYIFIIMVLVFFGLGTDFLLFGWVVKGCVSFASPRLFINSSDRWWTLEARKEGEAVSGKIRLQMHYRKVSSHRPGDEGEGGGTLLT